MEREANLPVPPAAATSGVPVRPINPRSSYSSSSSPPDFLRDVQAAFKRHRPLGNMQSYSIRPRRQLLPRREVSNCSTKSVDSTCDMKKENDDILASHRQGCISQPKNTVSVVRETHEDASVTPSSGWNSTMNTHEQDFGSMNAQGDQIRSFEGYQSNITVESTVARNVDVQLVEGQKKVHYATDYNSISQGADGQMATQKDDLLSHMNSLALTGTEWYMSSQIEAPTVVSQDMRNQNVPNLNMDGNLRSEAGISLLDKRTAGVSDQPHQFSNFLQSDFSHPMTQSSVNGSSCITTTLINSTSAPMLNSTTYCSQSHKMGSSHLVGEPIGESKLKYELVPQKDRMQILHPSSKNENIACQEALTAPNSSTEAELEAKSSIPSKEQHSTIPKLGDTSTGPSPLDGNSAKGDIADMQSEVALPKDSSSGLKAEPSKMEKQEKGASSKVTSSSRRKTYDPDLFFKVNGKLYQRLGKIGSGGSSEVHKVISSDCTIYALKRIKLKGRDYATAYGFCQEVGYLNRLKGKNYIIQLIDYEVTDKNLLQEVMNGSMSNKDGRVKEDAFIYMVLEYGEIDLAHMLSQKWRELDDCNATIDENWLRFYWQQILLAVNTIHEERIVHSDLKPANFLLVKGSLKLIDFGIAKAIMSDTTNIQRDAQVILQLL